MAEMIPIVCSYCGVGCNLELVLNEKHELEKTIASGRNPDLNNKYLCVKGASLHEMIGSKDRLTQPQLRQGNSLKAVSWDNALEAAEVRLQEIRKKHGHESVGMLCSGKIMNESAYLSQKFQRMVIGNNNVDNCARLCHGPSEVALRKQLGFGAVSTFLEDFALMETVIVVGAHTSATYPVIWMRLMRRAKEGQINLILADPRATDLVGFAKVSLHPRPGTDLYWINALAKIMYDKGFHDEVFCKQHTLGFQAYVKSLECFDVDAACRLSGVLRQDLEEISALMHGRKTVFIWGMGLTQHAYGTDNVTALVNLALLTGNVGKPGCGVSPLRGQNNVQGAGDMGALPNVLPGQMHLGDEASRVHIGGIWDSILPEKPGLSAPEMIHAVAEGKIRALYVIGENPGMSEPQSTFVAWMLQRLDLLIVQDIFPTNTAHCADIVLPAMTLGEEEGTFTNAARRVQFTAKGLDVRGDARPDWWILQEVARRMGHDWGYGSPRDIWEEIRQVAPIFTGLTHERLKTSHGIFWPCYNEAHEGTPRLYENGFAFRDQRARFIPVRLPEQIIEATEEYPYILITGRIIEHFNTGEMTRRSARLLRLISESYVEMHTEDAQKEGLSEGDWVRVISPFGVVEARFKESETVLPGYLFAPNHFDRPNFNALMSSVPLDPQARMPALKVVPVKIVRQAGPLIQVLR